jgi:mRNA interferase MazF
VPLTSSIDRLYPCEAFVDLEGDRRKAMADQIATVSRQRLGERIGRLSSEHMTAVERAIRVQIGL